MTAMPTSPCSALFDDMSGALTQNRLTVQPGQILHAYGVRLLVLSAGFGTTPFGERQELSVVAVSHDDARATYFRAWNMGLGVEYARREFVKIEIPQPNKRRWWMAVSLDGKGHFEGANGHQEGAPCTVCADSPLDPSRPNYEPCRYALRHAWNTVNDWDRVAPGRRHYVLSAAADTWEQARAVAAETCERIRTVGHL
uniref:hypothetical protein n=1 Tax=Streptomyces sp. CA-136453 TaxID=3240050 RepID=UPI003F497BEB